MTAASNEPILLSTAGQEYIILPRPGTEGRSAFPLHKLFCSTSVPLHQFSEHSKFLTMADHKFVGWVAHDKDSINGKMVWEEFKTKTWQEVSRPQHLEFDNRKTDPR